MRVAKTYRRPVVARRGLYGRHDEPTFRQYLRFLQPDIPCVPAGGVPATLPAYPMASKLPRLQSPLAVQTALDEFSRIGRSAFLARYGFGKSRTFLVRNPLDGQLCDSKAIVGAAFGYLSPIEYRESLGLTT